MYRKAFLSFASCLWLCSYLCIGAVISQGKGDFVYCYKRCGKVRDITVHYYSPERLNKLSRIVFVLHGSARKGDGYRDSWQKYANKYNFLVLCPELSEKDFSYLEYQYGNIYNNQEKRYSSKEELTFNLIEELFDFVIKDREMAVKAYCLFGHSAGAQFVHRMVLFMPEARFSLAIANGAGFYTLPNFTKKYSGGLGKSSVTPENLKKSFSKRMILLMGSEDRESNKRPADYDKAGKYDRTWKAQFFLEEAKALSREMQVKLNWTYVTVPDAHHSSAKYALWGSRYAARSPKSISSGNHKKIE